MRNIFVLIFYYFLFILNVNKITCKPTGSLFNAMCFKHDNSLSLRMHSKWLFYFRSLKMDSVTSIWQGSFSHPTLLLAYIGDFQLRSYYYSRFKIWRHIWIPRTYFVIQTRSFPACDTIFGDFCHALHWTDKNSEVIETRLSFSGNCNSDLQSKVLHYSNQSQAHRSAADYDLKYKTHLNSIQLQIYTATYVENESKALCGDD